MRAAQAGFLEWRRVRPLERGRILREAATIIRAKGRELAMIDAADCGNPVAEVVRDAEIAATSLEYFAGLVLELKGDTIPMGEGALSTYAPEERSAIRELWRWRGGVGPAVTTARGGKVSEDIVVPLERLAEGILATREIGARHDLPACSWGHAGDGNLHSTFMLDPEDEATLRELLAKSDAAEQHR